MRICPGSDDSTQCIKVMKTLQGHISSVRALSCSLSGKGEGKRLLFSGGARASLKVWCVRVGMKTSCITLQWDSLTRLFLVPLATTQEEEIDVTLEAELFLHNDLMRQRRRRPKLSDAELPPECRVMSLSSFPLTSFVAGGGDTHSYRGYHYVAAGCSDAVVRYV